MKRNLPLILFLVCLICRVSVDARTGTDGLRMPDSGMFDYHQLTTHDGLSNLRVFSLCRDVRGRMWIATKSGVDCYDGRSVKNYVLFGRGVTEDSMGRIIKLCEDGARCLWAYTNSGKIYRLDVYADKFVLQVDMADRLHRSVYLNSLAIDGGTLYAATSVGSFRIDATRKITLVCRQKTVDVVTDAHSLYLATVKGVCRMGKGRDKRAARYILQGCEPHTIYVDAKTNLLWVGTVDRGLMLYDLKGRRQAGSSRLASVMPHKTYRCLTLYDENTMLVGIDGEGIYAVQRDGGGAWPLMRADGNGSGLKSDDIYSLLCDGRNIWVGSFTEGVTVCNLSNFRYRVIRHEPNNQQSLVDNHVNAVIEDRKGNHWYATDNGLSVCNASGQWRHLHPGKVFLTLCLGADDEVWAGSYGNGAYCLRCDGTTVRHLTTDNSGLSTNLIFSICRDAEGYLWMGGQRGGLTRCATGGQGRATTFSDNGIGFVHHIVAMGPNVLAVATANGFYTVDIRSGEKRKFFDYPKNYGVRSNSYINYIRPAGKAKMWLATDGGGLVMLDMRTGRARVYTTREGLPSNYVYSVSADSMGRIWVSTDLGLAYMSLDRDGHGRFSTLSTLNEQVSCYKRAAFACLANGNFVYGSNSGAVEFNPRSFTNYSYRAPLFINGLNVSHSSDNVWAKRDAEINEMLLKDGRMRLRHGENTFTLAFSSVSFQYQNDILYTYCLKGFDKEWSSPSADIMARYTNIPPGDYTFRVKSISRNTHHTVGEASLPIHIAAPWWDTPWARLAYLLLFAAMLYGLWRSYNDLQEKRYFESRLRFFVNIAHDIRTPVTLIMSPLNDLYKNRQLASDDRRLLSLALVSAQRLYGFTTELLDFQKLDLDSVRGKRMKVTRCDLRAYLEEMVESFRPLLIEKKITVRLVLPKEEIVVWLNRKNIDHVLYNIMSNAVKYNREEGKIIVRLSQGKRGVTIAVRDTGIGIPRRSQKKLFSMFFRASNVADSNRSGHGIGLAFARRIMKMHKGEISFKSVEGRGTTFFVTFRSGCRHFRKSAIVGSAPMPVLPTVGTLPLSPAAAEMPSAPAVTSPKSRLMVVEDNGDLRFYLRHIFEQEYEVVDKPDGDAALEYLKSQTVDLIVSDIMMPGIQGDEMCRLIKQNVETSHIPVILLTAKAGRDHMLKGLEGGADDFIAKPFDADVLKAKVRTMIHNRNRLREKIMAQYKEPPTASAPLSDTAGGTAAGVQLSQIDRDFLDRCNTYIMENIGEGDLNVTALCRETAMSRTLLYEKLKALTGKSPGEFITIIRMREAAARLRQGEAVQDVAMKVGFPDAKYFSTAFKKHYGVPPSKYAGKTLPA